MKKIKMTSAVNCLKKFKFYLTILPNVFIDRIFLETNALKISL